MNNEPIEHTGKVVLSTQFNWPMRGGFMFHVKNSLVIPFVSGVLESAGTIMMVQIDPNLLGSENNCIRMECRSHWCDETEWKLDEALHFVAGFGVEIVYKEGLFGYSITPDGTILKKWDLDDGMC
jgi:hypothetical protein